MTGAPDVPEPVKVIVSEVQSPIRVPTAVAAASAVVPVVGPSICMVWNQILANIHLVRTIQ